MDDFDKQIALENKKTIIVGTTIVVCVVLVFGYFLWQSYEKYLLEEEIKAKIKTTTQMVRIAVNKFARKGVQPNKPVLDSWENPLVYEIDENKDRIIYTVISNGPDSTPGNDDDIKRENVNYNVSRMAGRASRKITVEFLKGLISKDPKKEK